MAIVYFRKRQGAGQNATEVVLTQRIFIQPPERRREVILKKVLGIKDVVPQEFKCRAMPFVCAGFGDNDYLSSGIEAIFRGITSRKYPEFLHRFHRWAERDRVDARLGCHYAIQSAVLVCLTLAIGNE